MVSSSCTQYEVTTYQTVITIYIFDLLFLFIMNNAFLKCYYGYKNRWDELLLFGVIQYLFTHFAINDIIIETWDIDRLTTWINRHEELIPDWCHIQCVRPWTIKDGEKQRYVFGGGEVFTDHVKRSETQLSFPLKQIASLASRWFSRAGRNYILKYPRACFSWRFILLWGIGKPTKKTSEWMYKHILPHIHAIVTREQKSFNVAQKYAPSKTRLYHDFALDVIQQYTCKQQHQSDKQYIIINAQYQQKREDIKHICKKIKETQQKKGTDYEIRYFPCEHQDTIHIPSFNKELWLSINVYDRQNKTIHQTCCFVAHASHIYCARLHIALLADHYRVPLTTIAYAPKIDAMIAYQKEQRASLKNQTKSPKNADLIQDETTMYESDPVMVA